MATQLSNDRLLAVLRGEGLTVHEYAGWRDRCRCHAGSHQAGGPKIRSWEPINGVMVHITAGGLGSRSVESYIRDIINGDPNTPCKVQFVVDPTGTVWLNSGGRSNHAGTISRRALAAVQAGTLSLSGYQDLRGHDVDGNTHFYGIENIAASSMNAAQRDASVRICAAICRAYGWTGRDVIGHGEASDQRSYSDPNLDMGVFRRDVMARVSGGTTAATPPTPTTPTQETDMDDNQNRMLTDLWNNTVNQGIRRDDGSTTDIAYEARYASSNVGTTNGKIEEAKAAIAALDAKITAIQVPIPAAPVIDYDQLAAAIVRATAARLGA